jgi:hypothetical protein
MTAREVHSKGTISNAVITSRFLAIVGIWLVHDLSLASQSSLIAQTSQPPGSVKQTTAKPAVQKPEKQSSGTATKKNQKPSESQAPTERNSRANRENAPVGLVATAGGGFVYKTLAGPLVEIGYNLGGIGQVAVSVAYGLGQDAIETSGEKFNRDLKALTAVAKYRQFIFNSFNISGGLGYKTVNISGKKTIEQLGELEINGTASAIFGSVALGNHWTLDSGLVIGVDWYGYAFAFAPQSSGTVQLNGSEIKLNGDASPEKEAKDGHDFALNVVLGYQF